MDTKLRTSFVPKKMLLSSEDNRVSSSPVHLLLSIGLIIFFMTLAVGGGVYLYQSYIEAQIVDQGKKLQAAQQAFEPSLIADIQKLNGRIIAAQELLTSHVAVSRVFDMLSRQTLQNVRFSDFKYVSDKKGGASITMNGETQNYSSVALQSDAFSGEKSIKNVVFSGLNPNDKGGVKFNVTATLDSASLLYKDTINAPVQ